MNSNFTRNFEIRLVLTALILATLFVTAYTPGLPLYGDQTGSVWVLRDIEDYDGAEKWKKFNREKEELHYEAN